MLNPQMVDIIWRVSSKSNGKECVEVAHNENVILIRDTKNRVRGGMLSFQPAAWKGFIKAIQTDSIS